jgi:hypothetical protein
MNAVNLVDGFRRIGIKESDLIDSSKWGGFRHELSVVNDSSDKTGNCEGATVWTISHKGDVGALAWDWFKLSDGVLALVNPVAIVSNFDILDEEGASLVFRQYVIAVNIVVNGLNWQEKVISGVGTTQGTRRRSSQECKYKVPNSLGQHANRFLASNVR